MTFRVSKYAHNSWKIAAWDKNIKYNNYKVDYFNFYGFLIMTACVLNFTMGIHFYKEMINENKIIQEKFEERKYKQMAFDYMIFSQSRKDSDKSVDQLSLV